MGAVKPKKFLGQHFLKNEGIAKDIADTLLIKKPTQVLEIGPGMGVLTKYLVQRENATFKVVELDRDSVAYLKEQPFISNDAIVEGDFLALPLDTFFQGTFSITGNYPYNISSQILFKVFYNRDRIDQLTGMFQREVARRVCSGPNSKEYGILSVLLQAFYDLEYLFTVDEHEFSPPPKVKSGVLRMTRNAVKELSCDEAQFVRVVKAGFNLRRKTLRNSLKSLIGSNDFSHPLLDKRPEQLTVAQFVDLTNALATIL